MADKKELNPEEMEEVAGGNASISQIIIPSIIPSSPKNPSNYTENPDKLGPWAHLKQPKTFEVGEAIKEGEGHQF